MNLIDRQQAIDAIMGEYPDAHYPDWYAGKIRALPSAQPEEAIPISWIEAKIERFMMSGDAFRGLTASIIRVMLNEWKKEQEGDTK